MRIPPFGTLGKLERNRRESFSKLTVSEFPSFPDPWDCQVLKYTILHQLSKNKTFGKGCKEDDFPKSVRNAPTPTRNQVVLGETWLSLPGGKDRNTNSVYSNGHLSMQTERFGGPVV